MGKRKANRIIKEIKCRLGGRYVLFAHFVAQLNKQLATFLSAALRPITLNAAGDHICHFVIDRLLFSLQPNHRAVKKALQSTEFPRNVDQQRHLVLGNPPKPTGVHQSAAAVM